MPPPPPPPPRPSDLPPQGVYESCSIVTDGWDACYARLAAISAGGFKYVLNYATWYASPDYVWWYAYAAEQLGLQLIWPLNHQDWREWGDLPRRYRAFSQGAGCTDNDCVWAWAIGIAASMPATWGYYIGDEVHPSERDEVAALGQWVKAADPTRKTLYVAWEHPTTGGSNIGPFGDVADVVASDNYPVGIGDPLEVLRSVASITQSAADRYGKESGMVLQAMDWSRYQPWRAPRWPTADEMRIMRDQVLFGSRPSMLLWYSFQDIQRADDPARRYRDLLQAAFAPLPS